MVLSEKENNSSCGDCGVAAARKAEDDVSSLPTADAVPFDGGDDAYAVPSTNPAAVPTATSPPHEAPAAAGSGEGRGDVPRATYFTKPTSAMIAQSKHGPKTTAGALFVATAKDSFVGKFAVPRTIHAVFVMSGDTIDLSLADFVHPVTTIKAVAVMGHVRVIVPRGVRVRANGLGILGEFRGVRSGGCEDNRNNVVGADREAPLVVLEGSAIMGQAEVRVNEKVPPVLVVS